VNSPAGRRVLALPAMAEMDLIVPRDLDPPNIYALYEESIGTISPLIADELRAAEEEYPPPWIEAAFREAAAQNRRSWRYVARILERWRDEGRNDATVGRDPGTRHDLAGRYRGLIRR
jgi:DnaD/phage-associated family protein